MKKAIQTNNLTKKYNGLIAVDSLNLSIEEGELFALLGINGAGKTTTIKMLSCLEKPTEGEAWILGNSILSKSQKVKELISVSPQETAIAPNLSVKENLKFMCGIYGMGKEEVQEKTEKIIKEFELDEIANKKARLLSGGWQRRLSIAMALITEPQVLFLDEPTLGLDVIARRELWKSIIKLKGKVTVILTTHYLEEAEKLSDQIGIMSKGNLVATGTAEKFIKETGTKNFEDAFVALYERGTIK
ncbi:MAG: ABC transporter ATP-binding protein [Sphaerochaetaceae bacterium]